MNSWSRSKYCADVRCNFCSVSSLYASFLRRCICSTVTASSAPLAHRGARCGVRRGGRCVSAERHSFSVRRNIGLSQYTRYVAPFIEDHSKRRFSSGCWRRGGPHSLWTPPSRVLRSGRGSRSSKTSPTSSHLDHTARYSGLSAGSARAMMHGAATSIAGIVGKVDEPTAPEGPGSGHSFPGSSLRS